MFISDLTNPQNGPGPQLRAFGTGYAAGSSIPTYQDILIPAASQVGDYIVIVTWGSSPYYEQSPPANVIPWSKWTQFTSGFFLNSGNYGGPANVICKICEAGDAGKYARIGSPYHVAPPHVFTNPRGTHARIVGGNHPDFLYEFQNQVRTTNLTPNGANVSSFTIGTTQSGQPYGNGWLKVTAIVATASGAVSSHSMSYSGPGTFRSSPYVYWLSTAGIAYEVGSPNTGTTGTFSTNTPGGFAAVTFYLA